MRHVGWLSVVVFALVAACPAQAEPQAEQPTIEALMKKIDALQRRLDEVEGRQRAAKSSSARVTHRTVSTPVATAAAPPPRRCSAAGRRANSRPASSGADGLTI